MTLSIACNKHPTLASKLLQEQNKTENLLNNWKIEANVAKSIHITFSMCKKDWPPVSHNNNTTMHFQRTNASETLRHAP